MHFLLQWHLNLNPKQRTCPISGSPIGVWPAKVERDDRMPHGTREIGAPRRSQQSARSDFSLVGSHPVHRTPLAVTHVPWSTPDMNWVQERKGQPNQLLVGCGSKPMVPFWDRCTTHFSLFWWGLACSLGVRGFDPWPVGRTLILQSPKLISVLRPHSDACSEFSDFSGCPLPSETHWHPISARASSCIGFRYRGFL